MPAAVVLDMDGTLLDTEGAYRTAFLDAFAAVGVRVEDGFYAGLVGISSRERGELVRATFGAAFPWDRCLADYRARKARLLAGAVRTKPGAPELLGLLAEHEWPYAVATSAGRRTALRALDGAGLLRAVPHLVTRDDVPAGKPDPALFLRAALVMRVPPARCLVVEDSPPGIAAARAAGMRAVMVPDAVPPSPGLREDGVIVASDLLEVRALLKNLRNGEAVTA